ncbi:MAG: phosphatidate cytidylyltransferase [Anaerolineae bacterium]|nr:phosphatidate cytidylyltransferase [Anaerolineae bacterium]
MLRTRTLVALVVLPFFFVIVLTGGALFQATVVLLLAVSAWELARLGRTGGYAPFLPGMWLTLGAILLATLRPDALGPGLTLAIIVTMAASLHSYHSHKAPPLISFTLTLGIGLYLGWLGQHLLLLRALPQGEWWALTVLPVVFAADSGAYMFGVSFGRHKLLPWVSPNKTWEGYVGGIASAVVVGAVAVGLWSLRAPGMRPLDGALLGLVIGVASPLGDLTVSSFKRQVGAKDTSHLIPGHGGLMDRMDTVLIAAALGYWYIVWFAG